MRVMAEPVRHQSSRRWGVWVIGVLAALVVLVLLAEGLAAVYTDFLWFHWTGIGNVWTTVAWTKAGLTVVFVVAAFALSWVSLSLVDKTAPGVAYVAPETDLVRRYQTVVGPHRLLIRAVVSVLLGIALGAGAAGQWQHWLLFEHAVSFGRPDPLFHLDDSFFVFRLPFLSFLVNWILVALLVVLVVSAVAHFLNGSIRLQAQPRIEPRAVAHLSLLLGAMALVRAWSYYYVDRYRLDLSSSGVVGGAGYTDVHVRLPAITLLAIVSLAAFVLLVVNAYQRSLTLPLIAVGLWAFLAIAIGVVYPAVVQAFKVNPAQSTLERPYIASNITATRYAMGIDHVVSRRFPANEDLTPGVLAQYRTSLEDSQLWDPAFVQPTFDTEQSIWAYFTLTPLAVDRYTINGKLTPAVVAVRRLNTAGSASRSWVNLHLQYTHGYGAVIVPSTVANASGLPEFDMGNLPLTSQAGLPRLTQPAVYFAPGESGYVVADTTQPEVNFLSASGEANVGHYQGSGGVPLSSWLTRAAYALRLKDFNLLVSNDITPRSRLLYVTDIRARVQKALPFLTVDANPYPVVNKGHIDWVVDAYTTSAAFPYGQPATTSDLPPGSPLAGSYDYVRDAVKVVVNAYTGKMRFYVVDGSDPLIRSYERAFPGLFQPMSTMDRTLQEHLRYPQQLLTVQAAMYGRYHVTSANELYANSDAWNLSQTSTSTTGSPSAPLALTASGSVARYSPIYQLLQLPGSSSPTFEAVEPLVPYSPGDQLKNLSAILFAGSSPGQYGNLEALVTGRSGINGPSLANADILHDPAVSQKVTLLDQNGSRVTFGTVQALPIADSLLYVRPLYVSGAQTSFPQLVDVIILYGKQIAIEPTLSAALQDVFGTAAGVSGTGVHGAKPTPTPPAASSTPVPSEVRRLVTEAAASYKKAQQALARGNLGAYQADVAAAGRDLAKAQELLAREKALTAQGTTSVSTARSTASPTSISSSSSSSSPTASGRTSSAPNAPASPSVPSATGAATAGPVTTAGTNATAGAIEAPIAAVSGRPMAASTLVQPATGG